MTAPALESVFTGNSSEWLEALPAYQRKHVDGLMSQASPVDAAKAWLANSGPQNTAPYGGVRIATNRFYENLLIEVRNLFCNEGIYLAEKAQIAGLAGSGKLVIMGSISAVIAPQIGVAAAVLIPAIAITLNLVGAAGKETFCQTLDDVIQQLQDENDARSRGVAEAPEASSTLDPQ